MHCSLDRQGGDEAAQGRLELHVVPRVHRVPPHLGLGLGLGMGLGVGLGVGLGRPGSIGSLGTWD